MGKSNLFSFPLLLTVCSNTIATIWAFALSRFRRFRPPPVSLAQLRRYVLPIGAITALELGCSNVALKLLDVSFGTIIKGAAPVFTMAWGLAFAIEEFAMPVFLALLTIAAGVALAAFGENKSFLLHGFLLQLFATSLAGLRWAQTQILLKGQRSLPPITVVLYTSPVTAICLLPIALATESTRALQHLSVLARSDLILLSGVMFSIGTLVFALLCSEYWLVGFTSSLALSVCAVFKEMLTIGGGLLLFQEKMSALNIAGFVICQVGIAAYAHLRSKKAAAAPTLDNDEEREELVEVRVPLISDGDPWDEKLSPLPSRPPKPI
eukprot:IDg20042t1